MPRVPSSDTSLDVRLRSAKESGAYTRDVSAASEFLARVRFAMLNLRKRFNPKKRALSKAEIPSSATPTAVPGGMPFVHRASTTTSTATTRSTTRWSETSATGLHGYTAASSLAESSSREGTIVGSSARSSLGPSSFNPAPIHVRGTLESFERRWREAGGKQDISRGGDLMDFSVNGSRFQGLD
ncbi:hypothetical protein HDU83_008615 [Entophlyctis luteolus]|nr:hypothetical protein HDU83_008615 [Entophlyctis luteolus]